VVGVLVGLWVLYSWGADGFGALYQIQYAMISLILSILGNPNHFSGMFLSLLLLHNNYKNN